MPKPFNPLGNLSTDRFLSEYWQKKPLLIRQALAGLACPIDPEELAGLACEAEIESRLIRCPEKADLRWPVRHGPFNDQDFAALPESEWTLLVQDVDKWIPALKDIIEPFRFIPDWRIDDIMISYAEDGGTVGPHWDDYDVFLIQAAGRREWRIDQRPVSADNCLQNQDLRLMKDFQTSESWILEPGDMLYLPPKLAHYGTAVGGGCMTCSIGFRAPDQASLIEEYTHHILSELSSTSLGPARYADPDLTPAQSPGEISPEAITRLLDDTQDALLRGLNQPPEHQAWLGQFLTRPKPGLEIPVTEDPFTSSDLTDRHLNIHRDARSRISWYQAEQQILVFFNGEAERFDLSVLPLLKVICAGFQYDPQALIAKLGNNQESHRLMNLLLAEGHLYFDD